MHLTIPLLIVSSLLALISADPVAQAVPAQQTIVPFSTLPACSKQCGKLYDVQGACSPPVVDASQTKSCFCADSRLTPFNSGTTGVCDQAQCNAADLTTIQKWYKNLCGTNSGSAATTTSSGTASSTGVSSGSSNSNGSNSSGDTWISTHVRWVIMAVILFIAIVGGWIGASVLRRRYLQRQDREFELRPPGAPWVAGGKPSHSPYGDGVTDSASGIKDLTTSSILTPPPKGKSRLSRGDDAYGAYGDESEKAPKRKWTVNERT